MMNYPERGRGYGHVTIFLTFGTASLTLERLNELNNKYVKILPANGKNRNKRQNAALAEV